MTTDELKILEILIEIKIIELERLQTEHRKLTGKNFTKPLRLEWPDWLKKACSQ
jgi:hypothetical protein